MTDMLEDILEIVLMSTIICGGFTVLGLMLRWALVTHGII